MCDMAVIFSTPAALWSPAITTNKTNRMKTKFPLGKLYQTRRIDQTAEEHPAFRIFAMQSLRRHAAGDWGDCGPEDQETNNQALAYGARIFSAYRLPPPLLEKLNEDQIWIITEADRSATTILWPSDY